MLEQRIEEYLKAKQPEAQGLSVSNLVRIPGGASRETWSFDARWNEQGGEVSRGYVLRRDPDASLLDTDRDIEFRAMEAVRPQGVPVPEMYWLETDSRWLERPFFLMEKVDGCETSPQKLLFDPAYLRVHPQLASAFVEILARIHAVDSQALGLAAIGGLGAPPDPDRCGETEIAKWESVVDQEALEPQPVLRAAVTWLRRHQPPPAQRVVLVHADYRTGNFLFNAEGEIRAILDWEMVHLGDPLEDVAWACIRPWRWAGDERIGGLMERSEFYRRYVEASGFAVNEDAVRFWEVLGNLKLAAIFLTGGRSFCQGRTGSIMMSLLARNIGRLELEIMDLMGV